MRVKAIRKGFYDLTRIKEGQIFVLNDKKHFSKQWMIQLDGKPIEDTEEPKAEKKKAESLPKEVI